jgi:methylated-DNA-[protein]-cysteine S-methyltransferase
MQTTAPSPIGDLTLTADPSSGVLTGVYMVDHRHRPELETFGPRLEGTDAEVVFGAAIAQLGEYFAGARLVFDLPTQATGTAFQRDVWAQLAQIPYGETITYAELALRIGNPNAVRAVGLANGRNPLSIVVPCHRVVGSNGSLTGFGGGIERKRYLLALERDDDAVVGLW